MGRKEIEFGQKHVLISGPLHRIGNALYIGKTEDDYVFLTNNGKIRCHHIKEFEAYNGELWVGPFPPKEMHLSEQEEELAKKTWKRYKNA